MSLEFSRLLSRSAPPAGEEVRGFRRDGPSDRPVGPAVTASRVDTNRCSYYDRPMQLCLDAADRLVELVEERRGPVPAEEAARLVLKLGTAVPVGLARSLLDEAVRDDARLRWA